MLKRIEEKLRAALAPDRLEVVDESHRHAGHAGSRPGGNTHFRVKIVSSRFEGLSRIARQRLIHEVLAEEFASGVHALAIEAKAPAEAQNTTRVSP